jgi:hypothetical protein
MAIKCRNTPDAIALQLRQEARFGCALCGCPILENAHIIPYRVSQAFIVNDMVALCPTCHTRADLGHFSEEYLRQIKSNPHNTTHVDDEFKIESPDLKINLGSTLAVMNPIGDVISAYGTKLLAIRRLDNNFLNLDVNLFDRNGNRVSKIADSKWVVDTRYVWDLQFTQGRLVIKNKPRDILLEIAIKSKELYIRGKFYWKNTTIIIDDNGLFIPESNTRFSGITLDCSNRTGGIGIQ